MLSRTYIDCVAFSSGHENQLLACIKAKGLNTPKNNTMHAEVKTMLRSLPGGKTIEKAIREMIVDEKNDRISFGPLGELSITEMKRVGLTPLYPWGRRFSTLALLLMRSGVLSIMRMALEIEQAKDVPANIRNKAFAIRKQGLILLRDIDERLFDIRYSIYDIL